MRDTWPLLEQIAFPPLRRGPLHTLQVNVGYRCNQSCVHCHVNAGPSRTEEMTGEVADVVLAFLERRRVSTLDITGGAPELNAAIPPPRDRGARHGRARHGPLQSHRSWRCPARRTWPNSSPRQQVEIVASMPCYLEDNVDRQRGKGVFDASIRGLRRLNALGYGRDGSGLVLDLVYNPQGPSLPPAQDELEADYKRVLGERHGIVFNRLYTLANMPIQRFGAILIAKGEFDRYLDLLRHAHLDANLDGGDVPQPDLGRLARLRLRLRLQPDARSAARASAARERTHLSDLLDADLEGQPIRVAGHCYGCTAGQGSSCGGALKEAAE